MSELKIVYIDRRNLKPYDNNSMIHPDAQINNLIRIIKTVGWTSPLIIDENNIILAGHGRFLAAEKMGKDKVPCIIKNGLSQAQKRAYVIADNKVARASKFNEDILRNEIKAISTEINIDILGFNDKELSNMFDEFKNIKIDEELFNDNVKSKIYVECDNQEMINVLNIIKSSLVKYKNLKIGILDEQI